MRFSALVLCAGLVGVAVWSRGCAGDEVGPKTPPGPPTIRIETELVEDWVGKVAESGEGVARVAVAKNDAVETEMTIKSRGPLTPGGTEVTMRFLDQELTRLEQALGAVGTAPEAAAAESYADRLLRSRRDLNTLRRFEAFRIAKEQLTNGQYLTLVGGDDLPPMPKHVRNIQFMAAQSVSGEWVTVCFLIDLEKRPITKELSAAIADLGKAERTARIEEFNRRPKAERRQWVDRYVELRDKAAQGLGNLTNEELSDYLPKRETLRILRVRLDEYYAVWMDP
jgi:hypothetical protein